MGTTRWDPTDWDDYKTTVRGKSTHAIFTNHTMKDDLNPRNIEFRESRDSDANPNSTPIIVALDVTGSMGEIAGIMAREKLGLLVEEILARKPVDDPHFMFMGVGDADAGDSAPLQVTQFEADIKIADQLKSIYLEGGGGGNHHESYNLPWYFAAYRTKTDAVEKGRRKGLLFTLGDEECPDTLHRESLQQVLGEKVQADISTVDLLKKVQEKYDVFHIIVEQGDYASRHKDAVLKSWTKVLGQQNVIRLSDYNKLAEVVVSAIEVHEGRSKKDVALSWDGSTSLVVRDAIKDLAAKNDNGDKPLVRKAAGSKPGVVRL